MDTPYSQNFDVIVVGGGHAGVEAAHIAARMGAKTALVTLKLDKIGWMPCNPAVGGVGKGHIVFEISALGGLMPRLCTKTYLQARMLNTRKGPAVHGLRLQIDKELYHQEARAAIESTHNLSVIEDSVETIITENGQVAGCITAQGKQLFAPSIVLTTGTFLYGRVHIGEENYAAGRRDEAAVHGLSDFLKGLDLQMGRLKTGTPPRLIRETIDFSKLQVQQADNLEFLFEFYPHKVVNSHDCYITHTNERSHEIIRSNRHRSPMFIGNISGRGPRYCPSIEDKVTRFASKESHHIFLEPESASSNEMYPNGISTSLPAEVQEDFIHSIAGFEDAKIAKYGYAIEYDFVHPHQLNHTLELKKLPGLFLAGQINGTTGYEEAAGQGLIAGINATRRARSQDPFILTRDESYIGIMIDDLVTLGVDEPYRMFTSRAEHRILLRQDNVFHRLMDKGYALGTIDEKLYQDFCTERTQMQRILSIWRSRFTTGQMLERFGIVDMNAQALREEAGEELSERAVIALYADVKYYEYIIRENKEIEKLQKFRELQIPAEFEFRDIPGLTKELQEKLARHRPQTIAQASIIPGMTPAALSLLIFKVREQTELRRTPSDGLDNCPNSPIE